MDDLTRIARPLTVSADALLFDEDEQQPKLAALRR